MLMAPLWQCRECGFVFCSQRDDSGLSSTENSVMTTEEYTESMLGGNPARLAEYPRLAKARHSYFCDFLGRRAFRILEIGCGPAEMAETFESLGCEYTGIDIDPRVIDAARARGVRAFRADFLDMNEPQPGYDVIVASQVLEHITNPVRFARKIASMLAPGGVFQCDVPYQYSAPALSYFVPRKYAGYWRCGAICVPYHLYGYTRKSMSKLFQADFDVKVFTATTTHPIWGQPGAASSALARANSALELLGAGSLLVACGKLRSR
jgi:SAM-dependent methyltransferase